MSAFPVLARQRVGCVPYLNARPLIHAFDGPVRFDHPARLLGRMHAGALDVALVPLAGALHVPHWRVVDGVAIASCGEVFSVVLAHRCPWPAVRRIALDPASRTSALLTDVILREFHAVTPSYAGHDADARLLIGSQAITFRQRHGSAYHYLDLGAEWTRHTGLPFVFGVWALRPGVPTAAAAELRALKQTGRAQLDTIAAREPDPAFALRYLTHHIRHELGPAEKSGIERFATLLQKHGHPAGRLSFV